MIKSDLSDVRTVKKIEFKMEWKVANSTNVKPVNFVASSEKSIASVIAWQKTEK